MQALDKMQKNTPITSVTPGSVARALIEAVTNEIGDLYDIMDFNVNQNLLSTATGSALDLIGSLYGITRKTIGNLEAIDKQLGAFYFFINSPVLFDITIPEGTRVFTDSDSFIGTRYTYLTSSQVKISAGRTRAFAGLRPNFTDSIFTAGKNTLRQHDFSPVNGVTVYCTNPKEIAQQLAFETDDSYRLRLIKQIRVASAGTPEAIRFAALSVSGVRDVNINQSRYGMGSYEVVVVPEKNGNTQQVVAAAQVAMELVRPLGVRMYVKTPQSISVDITAQIIAPLASAIDLQDQSIQRATIAVQRYINSLLPGDTLIYNRLISLIIDSSEVIKDVIIKGYAVNGIETIRGNYQSLSTEQLVPGSIQITAAAA